MQKKIFKNAIIIVITFGLLSFDLPTGWFKAGSEPKSYEMGIDKGASQDGNSAATIKSSKSKIKGFGTLMQNCLPNKYLGKRVRMSGYMKTLNVIEWAGFWLRVDEANSVKFLEFDNMHDGKTNRAVTGTTDWTKYEIVLDVPNNASNLAYGALLCGTGQIWFDKLNFEIVDNTIPTTGNDYGNSSNNAEPNNLDFEN